jgi:hypothetical protein
MQQVPRCFLHCFLMAPYPGTAMPGLFLFEERAVREISYLSAELTSIPRLDRKGLG